MVRSEFGVKHMKALILPCISGLGDISEMGNVSYICVYNSVENYVTFSFKRPKCE